jgi:class 3 adenylate cyclase/CHASE2 domain-containing sensor protein
VISTVCFVVALIGSPLCDKLEKSSYDLRMKALCAVNPAPAARHVTVVAIKEKTIIARKPFVFWYPDIGRFCSLMGRMGAAAVGIDLIPVHSLENKFGSAALGVEMAGQNNDGFAAMGKVLDRALLEGIMGGAKTSPVVQGVSGATVPFYYDILAFMENVTPASLTLQPDDDTIVRNQPDRYDKEMLSFSAELIRAAGRSAVFPPLLPVNFSLLSGITVLDFEAVAAGKVDPAVIKNRIVILGLLSPFDDVHQTATGLQPGMLIHASTIETLLSGRIISYCSKPLSLLLLALLSVISFPLSAFRSPLRSLAFLVLLALVYSGVAFTLFGSGVALPLLPHAVVPLLMFGIAYPYRYVVEERGRRKLYQTFSYYVAPEAIDRLITSDAEHLMKGERHNVCIMFLDIRGFTALSQKYESEAIVAMLNIVFEQVTEIVQNHGGFVNKFIGDGMLAIFTLGDGYVDDAIEASRDICHQVAEINASGVLARHIGDDILGIGIGLHSGDVILGNIGSRRKMDFTVIGRAVNAASRIESLTKEYSRQILMSSEVVAMSRRGYAFEPLGTAAVKGIVEGVEIFGLLP